MSYHNTSHDQNFPLSLRVKSEVLTMAYKVLPCPSSACHLWLPVFGRKKFGRNSPFACSASVTWTSLQFLSCIQCILSQRLCFFCSLCLELSSPRYMVGSFTSLTKCYFIKEDFFHYPMWSINDTPLHSPSCSALFLLHSLTYYDFAYLIMIYLSSGY